MSNGSDAILPGFSGAKYARAAQIQGEVATVRTATAGG